MASRSSKTRRKGGKISSPRTGYKKKSGSDGRKRTAIACRELKVDGAEPHTINLGRQSKGTKNATIATSPKWEEGQGASVENTRRWNGYSRSGEGGRVGIAGGQSAVSFSTGARVSSFGPRSGPNGEICFTPPLLLCMVTPSIVQYLHTLVVEAGQKDDQFTRERLRGTNQRRAIPRQRNLASWKAHHRNSHRKKNKMTMRLGRGRSGVQRIRAATPVSLTATKLRRIHKKTDKKKDAK